MKNIDRVKKDISEITSSAELAGYLDGVNACAIIFCERECPEEIIRGGENTSVSILGMINFLESEKYEVN